MSAPNDAGASDTRPSVRPLPTDAGTLHEVVRKAEEFTAWLVEFESAVELDYDPAYSKYHSLPLKYGLLTLVCNFPSSNADRLGPFFGWPSGLFAAILRHYLPSARAIGGLSASFTITSEFDLLTLVRIALADAHSFCAECHYSLVRVEHDGCLPPRRPEAKGLLPASVRIGAGETNPPPVPPPWRRLDVSVPGGTVWVDEVAYSVEERLPLLYLLLLIQQEGRPMTEIEMGNVEAELKPFVGKIGDRIRNKLPREVLRFITAKAGVGHWLTTPTSVR